MTDKLAKDYQPAEVESRWYETWIRDGVFNADENSNKPPFCIVIPPPNVTGQLHMGHALFVTIQDLLTRWKRMQGFEALWLPGTDHAGIATQVMVERQLASEGLTRHELGREKFLERVWQWKEEKGGRIIEQLKVMGASCDWRRERFTMDEGLSEAVREVFVRLYEEGLIYRGERLVNWDPVAQTVLSDLEVEQEPEQGSLWHIAYPVEGTDQNIVVATTRPETLLGDTAVAVHPEDERYIDLIGKRCVLPLTGRTIPIVGDPLAADPAFGSGAVKITPAHDFNDFETGVRNNLPRIQVIGVDARMTDEAPEAYRGLTREDCRAQVLVDLEAGGFLVKTEPHQYMPTRSQRSGAIVEPLLLPQWWVKADVLAKPAIEAVESGKTTMFPKMWEKTYFNWMYNIRDWCISRQLWWGHQIPAWYCKDCSGTEIFESHAEGAHDAERHIGPGARPIVSRKAPAACPSCGGTQLVQEPDVLDTWFSSALWPFSTMGWPENTATLEKFYPTSVMETGADIIFFWVARMMMMGLHFMGEIPFETVYFHALIRDKDGQKMSKTYGNVVDPLHVVYGVTPDSVPEAEREACRQLFEDHPEGIPAQGADALRFTLSMYAAQGRDIRLDLKRVEGYRGFLNKVWQASRFVLMNLEDSDALAYGSCEAGESSLIAQKNRFSLADCWILERLNLAVGAVTAALDEFRLNDAAQAVYDFLWNEFCNWYIELAKPTLYQSGDELAKATSRNVLVHVVETIQRLLHPFTPYVTEEIWQALPKAEGSPSSICVAPWPKVSETLRFPEEAAKMQVAISLIQALRNIRGESNVPPSKRIAELFIYSDDASDRAIIDATELFVKTLSKVDAIVYRAKSDPRPSAAATIIASNVELVVPLAGLIDVEEEKSRIDKAIKKLDKDIEFIAKKLGNAKFVDRAPADVVATERQKLAEFQESKDQLSASLIRLEAMG